jgi:hypothetical protein
MNLLIKRARNLSRWRGKQVSKHVLARLLNVDGAYLRFSGAVSVQRYIGDKVVEQASDPGIWELM